MRKRVKNRCSRLAWYVSLVLSMYSFQLLGSTWV